MTIKAARVGARFGTRYSKMRSSGTLRRLAPEAEFSEAWMAPGRVADICKRFGINKADAELVRVMYGLPPRTAISDNDNAPTPEDEKASLQSLDLAPSVKAAAEEVKAAHMEMRRNESESATYCRSAFLDKKQDYPVRTYSFER